MTAHEDPQTPYETMLDRRDMDCSIYACWNPIQGFVRVEGLGCGRGSKDELGLCEVHARASGKPVRWLES